MLSGYKRAQAAPQTRRMLTREELERMQGAIEIVSADGCIGYYVVTKLCGQAVIWEGKRSYHADWGTYGAAWRAYKMDRED